MADSVYIPKVVVLRPDVSNARHTAVVRITHWINTLSFIGLLVSGIGILLAHPRFYWGETGGVGTPSLFDLPLPFMLGGPSGWGRYLHFESAWICVINGVFYVGFGVLNGHFGANLAPKNDDLTWKSLRRAVANHLRLQRLGIESALSYNPLQRITYLAVIFVWFPLMIWTGLAMSPAVTSVFPGVVNVLGGHQTARTIHFFAALVLVLFVFVHIVMVCRAGFRGRVGAMITGRAAGSEEP